MMLAPDLDSQGRRRQLRAVRAWLRRWWPVGPLLAVFVGTGLWGLDYGHHWDEPWFFIPLRRFAKEGALMPGAYNYPSLSYYLSYWAGLPELIDGLIQGKRGLAVFQHLAPHVDQFDFRLRTRGLFLLVTALTIPCVYGGILATGRSVWAAVAGTAAVVGSFEVAYHARWIAPDGPLLAASAFTTWSLAAAEQSSDRGRAARWRGWAAVGAGLSTGTKYTAGLLVLPVVALALRAAWPNDARWPSRIWAVVGPIAIFGAVYLLTTPATVFDSELFFTHIAIQMKTYGGGFGAYTVGAGADHMGRMLLYLGGTLWSPFVVIALVVTGVAGVGAVVLSRRQPWLASTLLVFPILFVAYFSIQRTMIVRNLLVIVPPLAIAFAWGVQAVVQWCPVPGRWVVGALVGLVLSVNVAFVGWAADTVRNRRDLKRFDAAAVAFVVGRPDKVYLSKRAKKRLAAAGLSLSEAIENPAQADLLVFETDEGFRSRGQWPAHIWGLTETWFGPWEVNFERYPTWDGDRRLLVLRRSMAERIGLPLLSP